MANNIGCRSFIQYKQYYLYILLELSEMIENFMLEDFCKCLHLNLRISGIIKLKHNCSNVFHVFCINEKSPKGPGAILMECLIFWTQVWPHFDNTGKILDRQLTYHCMFLFGQKRLNCFENLCHGL